MSTTLRMLSLNVPLSQWRRFEADQREVVQAVVTRHGGVRAAARATGVDQSFISRLMRGQKVAPSAETLEALGLRAVPLYEVLKTPNVEANGHCPQRRFDDH